MMNHGWFKLSMFVGLLAMLFGLFGCVPEGADIDPTMKALKAGNFRGKLSVTHAGRPLSAGTCTEVFVGGEVTIQADGEVDFSRPPGSEADK